MSTDYRALCAELLDEVAARPLILDRELIARARAALAQLEPEVVGPTDGPAGPEGREPASVTGEPSDQDLYDYWISTSPELGCADPVGFARAVLARWGRPAPAPADGEVAELVAWLRMQGLAQKPGPNSLLSDQTKKELHAVGVKLTRAADLLEQRHPAPVPVSERLPGPEDCAINPRTGQGQWCWGWVQHDPPPYSGRWRMMRREWLADEAVAWLPAKALPLPQGEVE